MRKGFILTSFVLGLAACNSINTDGLDADNKRIDSLSKTDEVRELAAKRISDYQKQVDSLSDSHSGVKILSVKVRRTDYGKDLVIKVKNISTKKADAIRIRWQLSNNFDEDVTPVNNTGISQDILSPGQTDTYTYELYGTTATKASAFVVDVHYKYD